MLGYVMLSYVMLCCVVLWYDIVCWVVLCCGVLCWILFYYGMLSNSAARGPPPCLVRMTRKTRDCRLSWSQMIGWPAGGCSACSDTICAERSTKRMPPNAPNGSQNGAQNRSPKGRQMGAKMVPRMGCQMGAPKYPLFWLPPPTPYLVRKYFRILFSLFFRIFFLEILQNC